MQDKFHVCVSQGLVRRSVSSVLRAICSRSGGVCRPVHLATMLERQRESLIRCVTSAFFSVLQISLVHPWMILNGFLTIML